MSTQNQNEYLILFRGDEWYNRLSPEEIQQAMTRIKAWFDNLAATGKLKAAQPLARQGKVVSGKNGRVVADGPFTESKEAIGGYLLLSVSNLEDAVTIAKNCPSLEYGARLEVRPVAEECPMATAARAHQVEEQLASV
jgi:hypothetical protein